MKLTEDAKEKIDALSYKELLTHWRFAQCGDDWLEGETGEYWKKVMHEKQQKHPNPSRVSKEIGWEK